MSGKTTIEWTERTWNPIRGCSRVSPGCANCYAERQAIRAKRGAYRGLVQIANGHPQWTGVVRVVRDLMREPLSWRRPQLVFVNSMSDMFHDALPTEVIDEIFAVMAMTPQHTYQILTKRASISGVSQLNLYFVGAAKRIAAKMREMFAESFGQKQFIEKLEREDPAVWPLRNVWIGVSVENQKYADDRIPALLQIPAAVRWISAEPLLGPVNLGQWFAEETPRAHRLLSRYYGAQGFDESGSQPERSFKLKENPGLHWIVVGGESGPGARPMPREWANMMRDQCQAAGTPFFFKQWGEWRPIAGFAPSAEYLATGNPDYADERGRLFYSGFEKLGKKRAGRELEGRIWNEYPRDQRMAVTA